MFEYVKEMIVFFLFGLDLVLGLFLRMRGEEGETKQNQILLAIHNSNFYSNVIQLACSIDWVILGPWLYLK